MNYLKPIKFRGRDLETGEYVYGEFGRAANTDEPIIYFIDDERNWVGATVDEDSVAQLAGYDKDGNEVYEGDTMTNEDGKHFIVILKPQGCFFREKDGRRDYSSMNFEMTGHNAINKFTVKK